MKDHNIRYITRHCERGTLKSKLGCCSFGKVLLQGDFAEGLLICRDVDGYKAGKGRLELVLGHHHYVVAADPIERLEKLFEFAAVRRVNLRPLDNAR